ncbi:CMD domain protein [Microbacterium indicum]|uniref:CMD domain protein n=1 Tax=Microbacterium indicum TaxID=358100 RepID=UPI00042411C7|nr:CMD domain protein [Microbacterium indicum]
MPDIIELLAGLPEGHPLIALRGRRQQARDNAQLSFEALLEPAEPGSFPLSERYAVAAFAAQLHGDEHSTAFYADLLGDEAPGLSGVIARAAASGRSEGPFGNYREPGLQGENEPGSAWAPDALVAGEVGTRLAAALAHTHLLVFRPREASADAVRALADAGWSADDIVSLSQLVAFLSFQLRVARGLRVMADNPRTENGAAA